VFAAYYHRSDTVVSTIETTGQIVTISGYRNRHATAIIAPCGVISLIIGHDYPTVLG